MKGRMWRWLASVSTAAYLAGCTVPSDTVRVFVASSMVDVAQAWQRSYAAGGGKFEIHSGASTLLARQVMAGAEADFLLSAGISPIRDLQEAKIVARIDSEYVRNRVILVVAAHVTPPNQVAELSAPRFARIAMANPETAPAGEYTRLGLEKAGLWKILEPRFVITEDVRGTLAAVGTGAADAGFVYTTDARTMPTLKAVDFGEASPFPAAAYPLVMFAPETQSKTALWAYLHSEDALDIAEGFGFTR